METTYTWEDEHGVPMVMGYHVDITHMRQFAQRLLEEEHTVVTDGAGFGAEGYVRISYATSIEQIKEGVGRIRRLAEKILQV